MLRRLFIKSLKFSIFHQIICAKVTNNPNTTPIILCIIFCFMYFCNAMTTQLAIYRKGEEIPLLNNDNLFHSIELFRIYENTSGYTPIMIVLSEKGIPQAHLLATLRRSLHLFPPYYIKRCEIFGTGSYLATDSKTKEEQFNKMLSALTEYVTKECFLIEFRNLQNGLLGYKSFRENNYVPIDWLCIHNSLHSKAPEERLSPTRKRQIRKALQSGVTLSTVQSENEIREFAELLRKNYSSKIRKHFPNVNFFLQVIRSNGEKKNAEIFLVKHKEKIIGGSVCVFSEGNAYLWFSGGLRKSHPLQYPGVMAVWEALVYSYEKGYKHMEFMDVGLPFRKHGYRTFILHFGGKQVSTRRWFHFKWNWLNNLFLRFFL